MNFNSLYAIVIACSISLSATGYGFRALKFSNTDEELLESPSLKLMLAFGLGTGVLSLSTLVLGLAGMINLPAVILLLSGGFLSGGTDVFRYMGKSLLDCQHLFRKLGFFRLCVAPIAALALLNGLAALAPPFDIDVLNYHLAAPHIYAQQQRIVQIPGIYHSYFPFNVQMLYTLCLLFKTPLAPQCLHVLFGFANVVIIAGIAAYFYGPKTAILSATLFYTLTDVGGESPLARIDLGVSFYALLAFFCVLKAQELKTAQFRLLIFSAILGGLCAGAKYTALIVPVVLGAHILVFLPGPFRQKLKYVCLLALVAGLIASPWYLRNYFWTTNPVFPFLSSVFGKGPLTEDVVALIQQGNWNYAPIPRTLKNFLLAPWLLLVQREAFSSNRIGPLFLAYLPIFLLLRAHRLKRFFPLLLVCLLWFPFWFWTSPLVRFFFAPLGLICILLAQSIRLALRYTLLWRILSLNFFALWLTFTLGWNIKYHVPLVRVALGAESAERFLGRQGRIEGYRYEDFHYLNTELKPKKLLLFGSHGLYLQLPFVLAAHWASEHHDAIRACSPEGLRTAVETEGLTHIMASMRLRSVNSLEAEAYRCLLAQKDALEARPVYTQNTTQIFSLDFAMP